MVKKIAKAITAALFATGGSIGTALVDNSITGTEWSVAVGAGLVAGYAVWRIPNKQAAA